MGRGCTIKCVSTLAVSVAFGVLFEAPLSAAPVVTVFPVSVYSSNTAAMDASLGITGFQIDEFESTALLAGVTLSMSGDAVTTPTTVTSLANLYSVGSLAVTANDNWDGPNVLV